MKKKKLYMYATVAIILSILGVILFHSVKTNSKQSDVDQSVSYVTKENYTKARHAIDKLEKTDQNKNIKLYKMRINLLEKERKLVEEKKYAKARELIKKHLEKHPVSEDEELQFQLMLVEDLDKIDQLNKQDIKGLSSINGAISKNREGYYEESKKIIGNMSKEEKDNQKKLISKLEKANKNKRNIDNESEAKEKKLSDILTEGDKEVNIITQLKSDTSDNKDRGLVNVEISLLIKNETSFSILIEPDQFSVNKVKIDSNLNKKTVVVLPGTSYLLENIVTDAQPDQLSGELSYGKNKIGKLIDVERGYFEDERWVQL
ncbi:hypothetical protein OL233_07990 [Vagococcus sp. PNs007]|uniref:DUF5067 domain-containing protein n=1 Tax=Vagococcus proximus TaxID=2991417 RepID=A0ABT5X2K3_9ENTE|nr:hypothetical protein [Vagococcus proximus]MDF0480233.1 hypothetical protein [Vagococcus proximus]